MAEILVDGSSHAQGMGDERSLGGYAGRSQYAHERYSQAHVYPFTQQGQWERAGKNVFYHHRSAVNKSLIEVASTLEQHVDLIGSSGRKVDMIGVFDVGMFSSNRLRTEGEDASFLAWEQSLDEFRRICTAQNITAIIVGSPLPLPDALWLNGRSTNPERPFLGRLAVETARHVDDWAEAYISTEDMLGADKSDYMTDGIHLNGAGYQRIACEVIPRLNEAIGIPHDKVPLPDI